MIISTILIWTYYNTNIKNIKDYLETSLNMGFFVVTYDIPIELIFFKNLKIKKLTLYKNIFQ